MAKQKLGLGRGLGALLDDSDKVENASLKKSKSSVAVDFHNIPLDQIETNPYQPRVHFDQDALQELADSIKVQGIIQPITVRKMGINRFQLISGERRMQAAKLAGLPKVPAYIRTANDQQMLEMALIENIQRENLNPIEVSLSYQRLIEDCKLKQDQLGERVGKNRTTVNNYLRLLKLPPEIQAGLKDRRISMGHARALVNVEDSEAQLSIYKKVVEQGLSVRKVEEMVRELGKKDDKPKKKTELSAELQNVQSKLSSRFGTKVALNSGKGGKGEIKIPYVSQEDLDRILKLLEVELG